MGQCCGKTKKEHAPTYFSGYVPDDVVEEILIRLPPITLVQLSLVCKTWHSLINNHTFIFSHLKRRSSLSNPIVPPSLLIQHRINSSSSQWFLHGNGIPSQSSARAVPNLQLPLFHDNHSFLFHILCVNSVHGLVCLTEETIFHQVHFIVLWNPSIGKHLQLQTPTAFELVKRIGFGFDSKNNDFKVIAFSSTDQVGLYSLNKGAWRVIDFSYLREFRVSQFSFEHCFLGGNIHWIVEHGNSNNNDILMFNIEEEKFHKMELALELAVVGVFRMKITVIDGCLSVLEHTNNPNNRINVWIMKEYGVTESWTKMCTLNTHGEILGLSTCAKVLVHDSIGRELLSLHSFDVKTQETRDLGIIQGEVMNVSECIESLVLLDK